MAAGELKGMKVAVEGDEVVIRFPKDQDLGLSDSGKTRIVASSSGFYAVPGTQVKIGLNAIRPK